MIRFAIILSYLIIIFSSSVSAQDGEENIIISKINVEQIGSMLSIQPSVQNNSELYFEYNYLLLVKKTDAKDNLSVNQQSGKFTLEPEESKTLSETRINMSDQQSIAAYLYIRDENKNQLISKDSIEIKNMNLTKVEETSLMIQGLVVDDTKTKLGSDFYDQFFSMYNQLPKKYPFIIIISELPYRGMSSIINVTIDQDKILEFFANPDEDFIKQQAIMTLRRVANYSDNKEKIKQEFIY